MVFMKQYEKCSVLVSSCDKYRDAWAPFFTLMGKYWKDRPYSFYLNTETIVVNEISGIPVKTISCPYENCSWSKRLIHALKKIPSEYVIFMLEDFFVMSPVDQNEIDYCVQLMDSRPNIANINFGYGQYLESTMYIDEKYAIRSRNTDYYLNAVAALWRRKTLIKLLSPYESAWQFELYGSSRAKLYPYDFVIKKDDVLVFDYHAQIEYGYGIQKGMWLQGNVALFEKEGIEVPFENLGFYDPEKVNKSIATRPRIMFREKIMRLIFAGETQPRWEIRDQVKLLFTHPVRYLKQKKHAIEK